MAKFEVDGVSIETTDEHSTLLDYLREDLNKEHVGYSCRRGLCGSCAVKIDGVIKKSCVLMLNAVNGQSISTER